MGAINPASHNIVLVGDRGMLTSARIRDIRAQGDFDWISALRSKDVQALATSGAVSRSLFDDQDLVEISSPDFPGQRLVLCRNPLLAHERDRTRRALLDATQQRLCQLARRVAAGRLKDPAKIGAAPQRALSRHKVGKHFRCDIAPGRFAYHRDEARTRSPNSSRGGVALAEHPGDRQRLADLAKRMNSALAQEVHPVLQEMFNLAQQLEPFGGSPRLSADITRFQQRLRSDWNDIFRQVLGI